MPQLYDKAGICFQYPDDWELDEDPEAEGASVTVYSPGGAFWMIAQHDEQVDPEALTEAAVNAMREDYPDLESEAVSESLAGYEVQGYDLHFFCVDLTNTCEVRCVQGTDATYLVFCQSEDGEYEQTRFVFRALTVSLLKGLA